MTEPSFTYAPDPDDDIPGTRSWVPSTGEAKPVVTGRLPTWVEADGKGGYVPHYDAAPSAMRRPGRPSAGLPAPFLLRVASYVLDVVVLAPVWAALSYGVAFVAAKVPPETLASVPSYVLFALPLVYALGGFSLLALFDSRLGGTPGKLLLGLRVVTRIGQERLGFKRALWRQVAHVFGLFPVPLVGFLWAALDRESRAVHDIVSGTVVVRSK